MRSSRSIGVVAVAVGVAILGGAATSTAQAPPPAPPAGAQPAFAPDVVKLPSVHVVTLAMKGSYMQHPEALQRLGGYLAGKGITPRWPRT